MYRIFQDKDAGYSILRLDRYDDLNGINIKKMSYFDSFIKHFIRETLDAGGIAEIALNGSNLVECVYIFDTVERIGTVFTSSSALLNHYIDTGSSCSLFCELKKDLENEPFSILELDLSSSDLLHSFSNEISLLDLADVKEITIAMNTIFRGMNLRWVEAALRGGDRCFASMSEGEITGLGWGSIEKKTGHLISLGVMPRYRKTGIGTDLLYARLLWMKELGVCKAFSEISEYNLASRDIALRAGFVETGKIYLYHIK
ncbi:MAG: GNAT family N-acetyltransferase [Candidatus Thermoplasmatota archaeon]|nr:GNAT family N-acetyltransferase [Candidatus Thermoplasmatota archaeon]